MSDTTRIAYGLVSSGGINRQAVAAIENALLDIKGKALGVPVYDLFGGAVRTRISSQCLKRHWRVADDAFALALLVVHFNRSTWMGCDWIAYNDC